MTARTKRLGLLLCGLFSVMAACGQDSASAPERTPLVVFAASSLTEAFLEIERAFEAEHPEIDVRYTFAGSQVLRLQLEQGARADLFASANELHMQALLGSGIVASPQVFAQNELVVITPLEPTVSLSRFEDLVHTRRLVLGASNVPVGIYAREVLARAAAKLGEGFSERVHSNVVSEENNVRLARAKVELGEADAALVYRTDAIASPNVRALDIPSELNVRASYPIGQHTSSRRPAEARRLVAFLLSNRGQALLDKHGFIVGARGSKSAMTGRLP